MIAEADDIAAGASLRGDVCVVGAGPAGIAVARRCAAKGLAVILLESGGMRPEAASQALCRGEVAAPEQHPPAHAFRRRALGGTTSVWGGRCVPLDPQDFAARPWLDLPSPWPIAYDDVAPYWAGAAALLDIGVPDFDARTARPGGMKPMFPGFRHSHVRTDTIERFSNPTDFGRRFGAELAADRRITVLLHAVCTGIVLEEDCRRVQAVQLRTRAGAVLSARARAYVLAIGGLETPRLLLASRAQLARGIGNRFDQVGRHYMCHLAGTTGVFRPARGTRPWHGYERDAAGVYCRRRITVAPQAQAAMRIGNAIARLHHPRIADPAHCSGPLSALYFARHVLPAEYAARVDEGRLAGNAARHAANILRHPIETAAFSARVLGARVGRARKYPSVVVAPAAGAFTLDVHAEQLPNAESRIRLARSCDRAGVPDLRIEWRHMEADLRTIRVTVALIADALRAGGHGALLFDPAQIDADMLRHGAYGGHHLGTARMSASARTGVVDGDCRVHDTENLFVAGGAVFATSGQANPTFTILALALRLADHLAERLGSRAPPAMVIPRGRVPA